MVCRDWFTRSLLFLSAFALLASACSSEPTNTLEPAVEDQNAATTDAPTNTENEATTTAPEAGDAPAGEDDQDELAGASEEENRAALVDEITAILIDWQETAGAPGVSLSVRLPGQEPIAIANGVSDIVTQEPVTTDDYFRIASITKPMTAALTLQLIEEGLIGLDDPVRKYLPEWLDGYEYAEDITIRQLMDHTNGLIEYAFDPGFYAAMSERLETPIEADELYSFLAGTAPLFAPGTAYSYETGGFYTLGSVIETVTGNTAAQEMRARIFEPADAENIFLTPQEFPPRETVNAYGRASMYLAAFPLIGRTDEEGLTIDEEPVAAMFSLPQGVLQSSGWTGGGNEAQLESVSAVFKAMFDGTILSEASIGEMTNTVFESNYGLGLSVETVAGTTVYAHGGGVPGFRSHAAYLPDYDIAWAASVNLIPLPEGADVDVLSESLTPLLIEAAG